MEQDCRYFYRHEDWTSQPQYEWTTQESSTSYGPYDGYDGGQNFNHDRPYQHFYNQGVPSNFYNPHLHQQRPPNQFDQASQEKNVGEEYMIAQFMKQEQERQQERDMKWDADVKEMWKILSQLQEQHEEEEVGSVPIESEKVLEETQSVEEQNVSKDFERITGIIDFDTLTEEELECMQGTSIFNVRRIKPRRTEESQYISQLPKATEICETSQEKQELTQEAEKEIFGIQGLFEDEPIQEEVEEVQVVKEETESSQENMDVDSPQ